MKTDPKAQPVPDTAEAQRKEAEHRAAELRKTEAARQVATRLSHLAERTPSSARALAGSLGGDGFEAPPTRAAALSAPVTTTQPLDAKALGKQADDVLATPDKRKAAVTALGDLAAKGDAEAVKQLADLARYGTLSGTAAEQLWRAPKEALSAEHYELLASTQGRDPQARAKLDAVIQAGGTAAQAAVEGLAKAIERRASGSKELGEVLAKAPGPLSDAAYKALGRAAGDNSMVAYERLRQDASAGSQGAVQGLLTLADNGFHETVRDRGLEGLATAAEKNPAALAALQQRQAQGRAVRSDGVNAYFNAVARQQTPEAATAAMEQLKKDGQLQKFMESLGQSSNPYVYTQDAVRSAMVKAVQGPPEDAGAKRALLDGLNRADREIHGTDLKLAEGDITRASELLVKGMQDQAKTDPDMKRVLDLMGVMQKAQSDKDFAAKVDLGKVQGELQKLLDKPSMQKSMEALRKKSDVLGAGERLGKRMESGAYQDRLALMSPEERKQTLQSDLAQLARVDPAGAQKVAAKLVASELTKDPVAALAQLDPAARTDAIKKLAPELGLDPAQLTGIVDTLETARKAGLPIPTAEQLLKDLPAKQRDAVLRTFGQGKDFAEKLSLGLSVLGLADAVRAGDLKGMLSGSLDLAGSAGTIAGMLGASEKFVAAASKWGGVVGGVGGAVLSGFEAYNELTKGDYVGAAGQGLSAVGGVVLAGSALGGPSAPAWALVGMGLMGAGAAVNLFSDDDATSFAKQNGLMKQ